MLLETAALLLYAKHRTTPSFYALVADSCEGVDCTPPNACLLPPGTCIKGSCWWYPAEAGTKCGGGNKCDASGNCGP